MKTSAIVAIVIAVLVILGGWYAYATYYAPTEPANNTANTNTGNDTTNTPTATTTGTGTSTSVGVGVGVTTGAPMTATITLTANGFSPKSVTVKKGGTVTWKNETTGKMWVGSASHPTHTVYSGTTLQEHCDDATDVSFDQCENGTTYSFKFDKAGTWNYHNHSAASQFGSVVVVE